ncbi:hypothetical protein [Alkalicoccus chagannorensis]|uniref:hypothetical protein n=1 Tax=Alkalicoccus chagannorensis TaxID=427072 RepID=UPI0003FEE8DC|nr:hypothetical protein [Alkalicoccus chagannorensis]
MVWIRTQNGESLMQVREVTVKGRHLEGVIRRGFVGEWSKFIGKYESKDRALAVLQELYTTLEQQNGSGVTFTMPKE